MHVEQQKAITEDITGISKNVRVNTIKANNHQQTRISSGFY